MQTHQGGSHFRNELKGEGEASLGESKDSTMRPEKTLRPAGSNRIGGASGGGLGGLNTPSTEVRRHGKIKAMESGFPYGFGKSLQGKGRGKFIMGNQG